METVGSSRDGGYIVKMSLEEHRLLGKLGGVSQGWTHNDLLSRGIDLTQPLERVIAYTNTRSILNELGGYFTLMEKALDQENN
jgi:hypothetical protein